jgi:branched-chain amino acid transport system substrate-binding protein
MKMKGKAGRKAAVVGVVASVFLFCGMTIAAPPAPKTIKIGVSNCLTGGLAQAGKRVKQGYEIALKHINQDGGVYVKEFGKKIPLEIIMLDNETDATKGVARMEKLYSVDKVDVFLGGHNSALTIPQLAVAEKYRIPIIAPVMTSIAPFEKGYKFSFTPFYSERDQAAVMFDTLDTIPQNQRPNKIAYFEIQEEVGIGAGKYTKEIAAQKGYKIVTYESYAPAATDFSFLITKAKSAGAEILYTVPTPPQGARIIKQMKELDWAPTFIYMVRAVDDPTWATNLGKDGDYVCHSAGWDYHLKLPGVEKLNEDYKAAYGDYPQAPAGTAYATMQILADAIQRAGTLDKEKIRDAIAATNTMTVMGPMKFKPNGRGEGKYTNTMSQWQNGKVELVYPKEQASAPLAFPRPPWRR